MSRDMIVLVPNGRRVKVHCTADTSILQVLEDVCTKQGFQSTDYDLKHHNKVLDLTTTIRFCNLPNKAMLEMVEAEKRRIETNITIGLLLEDGERKTGDFLPNTSLYDIITSLAPTVLASLEQPTIVYMRQEVTGISALKEKSLRQLGLITGRAILRLLNKNEAMQANVSRVYECPLRDGKNTNIDKRHVIEYEDSSFPGPSGLQTKEDKKFDPIKAIKHGLIKNVKPETKIDDHVYTQGDEDNTNDLKMDVDETSEIYNTTLIPQSTSSTTVYKISQEDLERRLKIEEEVTFLGAHKAIVFMQPEEAEDELQDLPDDFYELSIEEVRKMYNELQKQRLELENTPLMTASLRNDHEKQAEQRKSNIYKNVVVRIQFPDHMILQGIFKPSNTIDDIIIFVKQYLQTPDQPFVIFTTPIKETLDPNMTLLEAKFVPCVLMHFKWVEEGNGSYLKEEVYSKKTTSDAASILASKYRAPARRKIDETSSQSQKPSIQSSTSKQSKVPKWFKK